MILSVIALSVVAGCNGSIQTLPPLVEGNKLLTVDFKEGQTLRYKFVSSRDIALDWEGGKKETRKKGADIEKSSESMEMVVAYTAVETDPFGLTVIEAKCESVNAKRVRPRSGRGSKEAVKTIAGKTWTFTVEPTGKIADYSQLDALIKETGEKAFRTNTQMGRIKDPDMIGDFVASQWFLWDAVSSIFEPTEGVAVGQRWQSKLSLPTPMVMRQARNVVYELAEIRDSKKGQLAVINGTYSHAESVPTSWPVPYTGSFQMAQTFGMLRGYQILELQGKGEELFNIDLGRTERYKQQYNVKMSASFLFPLPGANPHISINQTLTMKLLDGSGSQ
jgi:hypothetical protein